MSKPLFRRVWVRDRTKGPRGWKRGWQKIVAPVTINAWLTGNVVPVKQVPRRLRPVYRDTMLRLARAAKAYGHKVHVNSSYRDPAQQAALFAQNMEMVNGAYRPKPGRPLTAYPGRSPHERGIGIDVPDVRNIPRLIEACRKERLIDDVTSERWHLTNHYWLERGA